MKYILCIYYDEEPLFIALCRPVHSLRESKNYTILIIFSAKIVIFAKRMVFLSLYRAHLPPVRQMICPTH